MMDDPARAWPPSPIEVALSVRDTGADLARRWRLPRRLRVPTAREVRVARAIGLLLAFVVILAVALVADERIALAARTMPDPILRGFRAITDIGTSGWMFAVGAAAFVYVAERSASGDQSWRLRGDRIAFTLVALATSGIASQIIKHLVGRARPSLMDRFGPFFFDPFHLRSSLASFPSGHATTMATLAFVIWAFAPRWRWAGVALAVLIGVSRVVVGAHYSSDVLAGLLLGFGVTWGVARLAADHGIAFAWVGTRAIAERNARFAQRNEH